MIKKRTDINVAVTNGTNVVLRVTIPLTEIGTGQFTSLGPRGPVGSVADINHLVGHV